MAKSKRKQQRHGARKPWEPLYRVEINPQLQEVRKKLGVQPVDEVWVNDIYQVVVVNFESGMTHLSIKRDDRHVVRDWRHLQSIKNEICGEDRWGVEIFPPESALVDSANEYHLFVLPAGVELPFGFHDPLVSSDAQLTAFNAARERGQHRGRQRPFQPGLRMAEGRNDQPEAENTWPYSVPMDQLKPDQVRQGVRA